MIRIGTRTSNLALWQAKSVQLRLDEYGLQSQIVEIVSDGDQSLSSNLSDQLGQFVKSVDDQLINRDIDIAVHSSKDVPAEYHDSVTCLAYLERGSTNDIILFKNSANNQNLAQVLNHSSASPFEQVLSAIPEGGKLGTSAVRRQSFFLAHRKDVLPLAVRGRVETRIQKLIDGVVDAVILAEAGLQRLNDINSLSNEALELGAHRIPPAHWPTAPGQGAICVHCASDRIDELSEIRDFLNHEQTEIDVSKEKDLLKRLGGGCQFPVGFESNMGEISGLIAPQNWRERFASGRDYKLRQITENYDLKNLKFDTIEDSPNRIKSGPKIISTLNSDRMQNSLSNIGIPVVNSPVIELDLIPQNWPQIPIDRNVPKAKWPLLVLTSPFSAKSASMMVSEIPNIERIMWLAIGEGTARSCFRLGYPASICADARNRAELFEFIVNNISTDTPLYVPMSSLSPIEFIESLKDAGYTVHCWTAYSNSPKVVTGIEVDSDDVLLISSPSSAKAWIENDLPVPDNVLCMGDSTKTSIEVLDAFDQSKISVLEGPTVSGVASWWTLEMEERKCDLE